jgi:hypothetical protein
MSNENKQNENKQEEKQPATQVELTDEQLEQVVGGFNPQPDPPGVTPPPGPSIIGVL